MFLIRMIYFLVFGWWFSVIWGLFGYLLCLSIIGLPFGLLMLNVLPQITTLKQKGKDTVYISNNGVINKIKVERIELPFIIRTVYFIFAGWYLTGLWLSLAVPLCISIIGLPIGLIMINHIPLVLTLKRNY